MGKRKPPKLRALAWAIRLELITSGAYDMRPFGI